MALHHCEFGRGHDPPPPDRIAGESLPEQWKECKSTARAANRMEESGRSDAPRYSYMGRLSYKYFSILCKSKD